MQNKLDRKPRKPATCCKRCAKQECEIGCAGLHNNDVCRGRVKNKSCYECTDFTPRPIRKPNPPLTKAQRDALWSLRDRWWLRALWRVIHDLTLELGRAEDGLRKLGAKRKG